MREVPRDEIAALCAKYIASDPAVRNDLIAYHYSRGDFDSSAVLFTGTELAGFLLFHSQGSRIVVSAKVVLPKFRGGWANVLLMAALADQGFDAARHRVSFAERFPGKLVRVSEHYSRTYGSDGLIRHIP